MRDAEADCGNSGSGSRIRDGSAVVGFRSIIYIARMNALRRKPRLAGLRSRWLALFCIALTLTFGASAAVSASESAHHEVEVAQAASAAATIICLGDDRSCGLPDHDEDNVVPHLHTVDIGSVGLPAVEAPAMVHQLKAESVPLPAYLSVKGLKQPTPERPPRTTCI